MLYNCRFLKDVNKVSEYFNAMGIAYSKGEEVGFDHDVNIDKQVALSQEYFRAFTGNFESLNFLRDQFEGVGWEHGIEVTLIGNPISLILVLGEDGSKYFATRQVQWAERARKLNSEE